MTCGKCLDTSGLGCQSVKTSLKPFFNTMCNTANLHADDGEDCPDRSLSFKMTDTKGVDAPGQILPQVRQSSIDECCMHSLSAVDTLPHSSSQSFATEEMGKVWMMEDERSKKTGEAMLM